MSRGGGGELVGLLLAALMAAGSRPGGRSTRPQGSRPLGSGHDPKAYARSKLATLRARFARQAVRQTLERFGPQFFPGVPTTMLVGFSASSVGPREQGGPPDYVRGELGLERTYRRAHAADQRTRDDLHRSIADVDGAAWWDDTEGQWYLGLRRYADAMDSAAHVLSGGPTAIPTSRYAVENNLRLAPWSVQNAITAYSSGAGVLPTLARRMGSDLVPASLDLTGQSPDLWLRLSNAVAANAQQQPQPNATFHGVRIHGRWQAAHACLRVMQRVESGRLLAEHDAAEQLGWYPPELPQTVVDALSVAVGS